MVAAACSIRIFLPDGTPEGLRIIEKSGWNGAGVACPRAIFPTLRARQESRRTGVYLLVGPSDDATVPKVYIGQADPVGPRLEQHQKLKDFWTSLVFFVSKDDNLHKAHVEYIEASLVRLARSTRRCALQNSVEPAPPSLSEMDRADAEGFLREMLVCLPVIGITAFEKPLSMDHGERSARLFIRAEARDVAAEGEEVPSGFVVRAGSRLAFDVTPAAPRTVKQWRAKLKELGVLAVDEGRLVFTADYSFESPSAAAAVILGHAANGRTAWQDESGRTLKEIQTSRSSGPTETPTHR